MGEIMRSAAATGLCAGIGLVAGYGLDSVDRDDLRDARQELIEVQGELPDAEQDLAAANASWREFERPLGRACMESLHVYLPRRVLAGTDEFAAAQEVSGKPEAPCGEDQQIIRANLMTLTSHYETAHERYGNVDLIQQHIEKLENRIQKLSGDVSDTEWPNGFILGSLFGVAIVGVANSPALIRRTRRNLATLE